MSSKYEIIEISKEDLLSRICEMKSEKYRMVQINCTKLQESLELHYSFAKEYDFLDIKMQVPFDAELPSISELYEVAFLYENELKDLFGMNIKHISIDYKGNFYKTAVKAPFGKTVDDKEEK